MSLVAVLVGVVALLSDFLLPDLVLRGRPEAAGYRGRSRLRSASPPWLIAPIAAVLIQLAVSPRCEHLVDASAAEITGDAEGFALALRTLELDQTYRARDRAVAHLYIENPQNQADGDPRHRIPRPLFDTHPPLGVRRIAALEEAGGFRLPPA